MRFIYQFIVVLVFTIWVYPTSDVCGSPLPALQNTDDSADLDSSNLEDKKKKSNWRKDPSVKRHPGSYIGGGLSYMMADVWYTVKVDDFESKYSFVPIHGISGVLRVGDAFKEWLAIGFQIMILNAQNSSRNRSTASFGLLLDTSFYPWRGLGIRPSVGFGFGFAQAGKESYQLGFGGPACLSFALSYEIRITRLFMLVPTVAISWIGNGNDFNIMTFTAGIDMLKWFITDLK